MIQAGLLTQQELIPDNPPLAYVGGYAVAHNGSAGSGRTITHGITIEANDLVLWGIQTRNCYPTTPVITGHTDLYRTSVDTNGPAASGNEVFVTGYFIAAGGETSFFFGNVSSGSGQAYVISVWRGAKAPTVHAVTSGTDYICPSIIGVDGAFLTTWHGTSYDPSSLPGTPAGMTGIAGAYHTSPDVGLRADYEALVADGATGTRTYATNWSAYAVGHSILVEAL